jgi:hypothetical protein
MIISGRDRVLDARAAARRLQIPERTLRYRAGRGRIPGAFKQGKLWKFSAIALEGVQKGRVCF